MSSTGQCSEHIGGALGIYDVGIDEEDMDRRVYKQRGGEHYIYKDEGKWYVGHKIQRSIALSTTHLFDTESVWSCAYNHTSWINDDTIKFSPLTSDSCILSSRLQLSSAGPITGQFGLPRTHKTGPATQCESSSGSHPTTGCMFRYLIQLNESNSGS